jgi:TRAP-type mannitol/chloroaromatic compound transport system permease large subunit
MTLLGQSACMFVIFPGLVVDQEVQVLPLVSTFSIRSPEIQAPFAYIYIVCLLVCTFAGGIDGLLDDAAVVQGSIHTNQFARKENIHQLSIGGVVAMEISVQIVPGFVQLQWIRNVDHRFGATGRGAMASIYYWSFVVIVGLFMTSESLYDVRISL